jgi:putative oxidoreductase
MLRNLLRTPDDRVIAFLRVVLAIVVFPHGAQKMLGWFGGFGPSGTLGFLTQQMHIPAPIAMLVFVGEFFAPIALFFGFLGRLSALAIAIDFLVVVFKVHIHNGFFMNWGGQQKGDGVEFFILLIAIAIALVVRGSGAWSIDRMLARETAPPRAV